MRNQSSVVEFQEGSEPKDALTELLRQVRRLEVRTRKAVRDLLAGSYASVFRGWGLAFEEVREYQPGDDIRFIDWNVTARMGSPYVKQYREERERTVLLVVDVSASQGFGTGGRTKWSRTVELAALIVFSAVLNNDKVGLVAFTDRVEHCLLPRRGARHGLRLLRDLLWLTPESRQTSLQRTLQFVSKLLKRHAIVFLISDFLDEGFDREVRLLARRHELVAVMVYDAREAELPDVGGLLFWADPESGRWGALDGNRTRVRQLYAQTASDRRRSLQALCRSADAGWIELPTDEEPWRVLVRFFGERKLPSGGP